MCLICQNFHALLMRHLNNRPQIRAYTVIGRIIDKYRHGVRIFFDRPFHISTFHPQRYSQPLVHIRIYIDGLCSAEHHGVDCTAVHISRQYDLVAFLAAREDHSLNCRRRSSHHQECMFSTKCVSRQLLRLFDHGYRVAQIVQGLHGIHVDTDTPLPQ